MSKRNDVSDQSIKDAWDQALNAAEVAKVLNVSRKTACKWLRSVGINPARSKYHRTHNPDYGKMASWLRDNPSTKLPRSVNGIAELMDVSVDVVRSYLRRRSIDAMKKAERNLKVLLNSNKLIPDKDHKMFHSKAVLKAHISIDPFTTKPSITITLKTGSIRNL